MKKFMRYAADAMLAISFKKSKKDYAGHVVRMPIERCEKQLMLNDGKYHRIGRITLSLLEQVLKFNNSTIDNFINNYQKRWLEIWLQIPFC